jgi:tyrosine-protein kinase Etk/Wzc
MPQYDFQITDFERIFRKRYKLLFFVALIVVTFSIIFGRMKPAMYSTAATVKVDRSSMTGMGMENIIWSDFENVETQTKVINSFPVLFLAAKRMKLVPDTISEEQASLSENFGEVIGGLRGMVNASLSGGTNIIKIETVSADPEKARDVANAVAFAFKEFSVLGKKKHAAKIRKFIEEQMLRIEADMNNAEQDVRDFEEKQEIPSLDLSARNTIEEAATVKKELTVLDDALNVIREQRANLKIRSENHDFRAPVKAGTPGDTAVDSRMSWVSQFTENDPGLSQLNSRLIQLQLQLDDQLAYYQKDHPMAKDIEKKIQQTIDEILNEYEKKEALLIAQKKNLIVERDEVEGRMRQLPGNQMQYSRLLRSLKVNEELFTNLKTKHQEALIAEAGVVDDITIMSTAILPREPMNKNTAKIVMIGAILGLLIGVFFAVVREMFDTSIGTIEDVERTLKMTVLAVIPHIILEEQQKKIIQELNLSKRELNNIEIRARLVTQFDPNKPIAEAYRILRTNIEYLSFEKTVKTIHLTSATMQEGKSTTIANLAVAFAQQGKNVLLLECNLRRPSLYKLFGLEKGPGITDILIDRMDWRECVKTVTDLALGDFSIKGILNTPGLENLNIITYGHTPPNPAELLSSVNMDNFLKSVREAYDVVLVDAPPLLPVADSMVLSTKVDGVILVYKVGSAPRSSLYLARERLATVQANVLGLVLNDIRPETSGISYSRMYARYYGREQKKKSRRSFLSNFTKKT